MSATLPFLLMDKFLFILAYKTQYFNGSEQIPNTVSHTNICNRLSLTKKSTMQKMTNIKRVLDSHPLILFIFLIYS